MAIWKKVCGTSLAGAMFASCMGVSVAEPVTILGLPLGGKLAPVPRVCKSSELGQTAVTCFVGKPSKSELGQYGTINVPDAQLPKWAVYGTITVSVDPGGALQRVDLRTAEQGVALSEVIASIASRFGAPTARELTGTDIPWAAWELPSVRVRATQWGDRCCDVSFITPKAAAQIDEDVRRRKAIESARPVSP